MYFGMHCNIGLMTRQPSNRPRSRGSDSSNAAIPCSDLVYNGSDVQTKLVLTNK